MLRREMMKNILFPTSLFTTQPTYLRQQSMCRVCMVRPKQTWLEVRSQTNRLMNCDRRQRWRVVHYRLLETVANMKVVPFVFESHGGLGKCAEEFIDLVAQCGDDEVDGVHFSDFKGYMKRRIAIAIQRGNALLDQRAASSQANSIGARIARGLIPAAV